MMSLQRMMNNFVASTSGTKTPSTTAPLPTRNMSKNPFRDYQVNHDKLPHQLYHVGPNVGLGGYSVKAPSQEIPEDIKQSVNNHRSVTGKYNTCWISVYPDRNKAKEEANKQSVSSGKVHVVFVVDNTQLGDAIIIPANDDGSELLVFGEIPEKSFISIVKTTPTATPARAEKGPVVEEFFDAEDRNDDRGPSSGRSEIRSHGGRNSKNKKQAAPAASDAKEASSATRTPKTSKPFWGKKGKGISNPSGDDDDSGNDSPDPAKRPPPEQDANAPTAVPEDEWNVSKILFDESRRLKSLGPPTNKPHYLVEWASDKHGGWKPSWENKDATLFVKHHHISEYEIERKTWAANATSQEKKEMKSVLFKEERGTGKDMKVEWLVDWTIAVAPEWKSEDEVPLKLQRAYEKLEGVWVKAGEKRKKASEKTR